MNPKVAQGGMKQMSNMFLYDPNKKEKTASARPPDALLPSHLRPRGMCFGSEHKAKAGKTDCKAAQAHPRFLHFCPTRKKAKRRVTLLACC